MSIIRVGFTIFGVRTEHGVLPHGKITTGETPEDIKMMDFHKRITQDEPEKLFFIHFIS